jgi:DNA helicase-2/ATP-dependent DNA helicase PcrA
MSLAYFGTSQVLAGAGSGKTMTLIRRIEYLLCHPQRIPGSILVLTFSRNAAQEMRERLRGSRMLTHDVRYETYACALCFV